MKPQNKKQKAIIALRDKVKPHTKAHKADALSKHTKYVALAYKEHHYCLECNHVWKASHIETKKAKKCHCPKCKNKLEICPNKDYSQTYYYAVVETIENHQLIRVFSSTKYYHKKHVPGHKFHEVIQHYINEQGELHTITKLCSTFNQMYYDMWTLGSTLEFRVHSQKQKLRENVYIEEYHQKKQFLPIVKRNGLKSSFHGIQPQKLIQALITNNDVETHFKNKQYSLVKAIINENIDIKKHLVSIKIALRHNYNIKDVSDYVDYLDLLEYFNKDITSPKYLCPTDFKKAHDKLVEKKTKIASAEEIRITKERYEEHYKKLYARYFGLKLVEKGLTIEPLKTIDEFYQESNALKHCVWSREYYKRRQSLMLSAKLKGEHLETIEFSLKDFKITQARGKCNVPSKYNKRVRNLVNENINQIVKLAS